MLRRVFRPLLLAAGLLGSGAAFAATPAVVTNDLNIRTGPASDYQRFAVIPAGERVRVFGCLRAYNWCDIAWNGERGWVHGAYLATLGRDYYREPIPQVAVRIGVPVYGFEPYSYHRRYYAGRPWYHDRYLGDRRGPGFDGPPPPPPPPRYWHRDREFGRDFDRRGDDDLRVVRRGPPPPPPPGDDFGPGRGFDRDRDFRDPDRFEPRGVRRYPPPPPGGGGDFRPDDY
ncbi:SH3 domain-containing protein [Aureimonas leprariae]|uniref:SH3 domain-containing protein n=1 Tax=Plantimonas leprariae TaxID=2615207 RepID=A0A7V7PRT4_9HYPH|nr:SH3 domain-containing protein [Aureimonas leprariae]KAB0681480.1 SH3 domain-containing protein [Aureimonas leprariae]